MFCYQLLLFFLFYELLPPTHCEGNYFWNRYTKDLGRTVPKHTMIEKDETPQYIDEVVEVPTDERVLRMFENLRLAEEITRSKPGHFQARKIFTQGLA
ncbi:unnamed protein product [Cylicocyclus nassatus]|uniref:Uncharacterized protein n=1 Tax=Cylicocyclus nassatus TaxID=53992 RepID=A0AA36H790_CYLNA|nr:unnamed protein product [Cylicocyclus nassatus]